MHITSMQSDIDEYDSFDEQHDDHEEKGEILFIKLELIKNNKMETSISIVIKPSIFFFHNFWIFFEAFN